jgi:hypothetical protein
MITALPRIAVAMHDFDAALTTFGEGFGMPVLDFSDRTVPTLGAHVAMCVPRGGSNVELMAPADPTKPLSQALQKFLDRRGDGLYALMLEAPAPDAEASAVSERGLDVLPLMAGAGGRDVHPRSTHGVLIRIYPDNSAANAPRDGAAPGLSGIVRAIVATTDASLAANTYGHGFGLDASDVRQDHERGVVVAEARAPKGGVIELVSAVDDSRPFAQEITACVKEQNGGIYGLVLRADDPAAALELLKARGFATVDAPAPHVVAFGTRFFIE